MTVTPASLIAAYPEWTHANTSHPAMVLVAIAQGVAAVDSDVVGSRVDEAVMLHAGAWLYDHPFARDAHKPDDGSRNPYREQFDRLMRQRGSAYRTVWEEGVF